MSEVKTGKDRLDPVEESPETKALKKFFPQGQGTLRGEIVRGFFGPDSPEVREEGRMASKWIMGGLFCVFSWDEWTFSGVKKVNPIHGYSIVGWDSWTGSTGCSGRPTLVSYISSTGSSRATGWRSFQTRR